MLDDLVGVIETLQQRIRDHGPALRENETRTRMALIDPLLAALGWNVSDPPVVTPEYNVSGRWADYALLRPDGQPAATLEAKKLGESLASHRMQMLNYSNASGVEYAGLTDGNHWELYEVFQRGQLEDRRILDVSIADAPAHESVLKLLLLWQPNLASDQPMAANRPILLREEESDDRNPPPPPSDWILLAEVKPEKGKKPRGIIKFSNEEPQPITDWMNVLEAIGKWLYINRHLRSDYCTLPNSNSQRAQFITHTQPVHKSGRDFATSVELGPGVFMELNFAPVNVLQAAIKLLKHCGVSPDTVQLQIAQ